MSKHPLEGPLPVAQEPVVGKRGKRPASPLSSDHVHIKDVLAEMSKDAVAQIPKIPTDFGHGFDFGLSGWGIMANGPCDDESISQDTYAFNGVGDCADAAFSHLMMEAAKDAGRPIPKFTCASTANNYAEYLGLKNWHDLNADNDQGTDLQQMLTRVQTVGFTDADGVAHKIGQTVTGDPGNIDQLWAIAYLFEVGYIGVNLLEANEQGFPGILDYVKGSPVIGGHCLPVVGNNGVINWAYREGFTPLWFEKQCDEFYGFLNALTFNKVTGKTLEGQTEVDLAQYATEVINVKVKAA